MSDEERAIAEGEAMFYSANHRHLSTKQHYLDGYKSGLAAGRESMRASKPDVNKAATRTIPQLLDQIDAERFRSAKLVNDLKFARTWLDAQEFAEEFSRIMDEYEEAGRE